MYAKTHRINHPLLHIVLVHGNAQTHNHVNWHGLNDHRSSPQNSDILIHERRKDATRNDRCVVEINPLNSGDRWFSWAEWIPSSLQSRLSRERKNGEKRKGLQWSFRSTKEAKLLNWKRRRDRSQSRREQEGSSCDRYRKFDYSLDRWQNSIDINASSCSRSSVSVYNFC